MKAIAILSLMFFVAQAQAGISISKGKVYINVAGGDANEWGENGGSAGGADVTLSYADSAKTLVSIVGTMTRAGRSTPFNEEIALKDLKEIIIDARGGNGANGYPGSPGSSGQNGSDGYPGQNGSDGCPPSDGGRGGDGGNGSDGGPGGNGGDGGYGGHGGNVHVNASADQNELMLFVKFAVGGGYGGDGGSGGSGGSGGRGGSGGFGGRGGTNTCTDSKGNRTGGPDGSNGWNGSDGRSGNNGPDGYAGRGGGHGRVGAYSYNVVSPSGTQSYTAPFELKVSAVHFADDTGDQILEPGERAYITSLQVTNIGPMPSPVGQNIKVSFLPTSTLSTPAALTDSFAPFASGATATLTPKKGALMFQVPDQTALIGKKATSTILLSINGVSLEREIDSGMAIHWPATLSAATTKTNASFEIAKPLSYSLKNVGATDLGPHGSQPVYVEIAWSSKTIPAADVSIATADGHSASLAKPVTLSDLTIPANGTLALPLSLLIRDSKSLRLGTGTLSVSLRLQDLSRPNEIVLQTVENVIRVDLDLKLLGWNQTLNLAGTKIECLFPSLPTQPQLISSVQITKPKASDRVSVQVAVPGSATGNVSPVINLTDAHILPFYETLSGPWTPQSAVDFLNRMVSPNAPKGVWSFKSCSISP
jgi:hypothetical protein